MNTYVMGELAILLAVTVLAGILIGWCIKSLFTGRTERKVRAYVARDVDDAAADVANIRQTLMRREAQLKDANQELQRMRGRDISLKAGNTTQIDEINKLKNELAQARQSLDRNRADFNSFRNEKQTEIQSLGNKLASFQSGGAVHDERMSEASDTIGALRTAVRENDKVISSLRARIKEGDSSVENLRTQLRTTESTLGDAQSVKQSTEATIAKLNVQLLDATGERDKYKRDYDALLDTKNKEISKQNQRLEELGKVQTQLQKKEHEYNKLTSTASTQLSEVKRTLSDKENQNTQLQDQIAALEAKIKSLESLRATARQAENKTAEVVALNDMLKDISAKRTLAQTRVTELENRLKTNNEAANNTQKLDEISAMLRDRDATIATLRTEMDDIVSIRNSLSIQLGELETNSEKTKNTLLKQSEQQAIQMKAALQDRDNSFEKLRADMDQMSGTRDHLTKELEKLQQHGSQLDTFKADMQSKVAQRESELQQRKAAYEKLQKEFQQVANTRDDYEKRISALTQEVSAQATRLQEQEKRSNTAITELQPQLATLRSKLSLADSENLKLSSELADTAALKLAITDRDATIQKLQLDLQDVKLNSASAPATQEVISKVDKLTAALKDRDGEITRLNSIVTDNRLSAKKYQSETTLLRQEIESQGSLIKGLEDQAENTLVLHKKIAAQSTELESLRASLYENDGATANASDHQSNRDIMTLKDQLTKQGNETATLRNQLAASQQSLANAQAKLKQVGQTNPATAYNAGTGTTPQTGTTANASGGTATKPRVFVRQNDSNATESLTGVSASAANSTRAAYTRDGYKVQRADGKDNLTLLPGIDPQMERELNNGGVSDFEQIALWGKREISHFADRVGLSGTDAEGYNWPELARSIIEGSYRRSQHMEKDHS